MRTTLTLNDQVLAELKALAEQRRLPFKDVVDEVLRRGLRSLAEAPAGGGYQVEAFASDFAPGVDPQHLGQALDNLEAEAVLAPTSGTPA